MKLTPITRVPDTLMSTLDVGEKASFCGSFEVALITQVGLQLGVDSGEVDLETVLRCSRVSALITLVVDSLVFKPGVMLEG